MVRKPRIVYPGAFYYIILRGNIGIWNHNQGTQKNLYSKYIEDGIFLGKKCILILACARSRKLGWAREKA